MDRWVGPRRPRWQQGWINDLCSVLFFEEYKYFFFPLQAAWTRKWGRQQWDFFGSSVKPWTVYQTPPAEQVDPPDCGVPPIIIILLVYRGEYTKASMNDCCILMSIKVISWWFSEQVSIHSVAISNICWVTGLLQSFTVHYAHHLTHLLN